MSATSTRRRVLAAATAVSFGTVAPAAASAQREDTMPRDQVAARDPDAEIRRLYDAIVAQQAAFKVATDANEEAHRLALDLCPPRPVLCVTGMTEEEAEQVKVGDPLTEQQVADFEEHTRRWRAWQAECKRIDAEHGYVDDLYSRFEGRLDELRVEMAETPARTPRGVLLKLLAAEELEFGRDELVREMGYTGHIVISAMDDLEAIVGEGGDHAA